MTQGRAKIIARDQIGSIHGQLIGHRHKGMGIRKFKWSTSQDERVREAWMGQPSSMPSRPLLAGLVLIIIAVARITLFLRMIEDD